jgi:hypothetical protein
MPYQFSDSRIGLQQATYLSSYIHEEYYDQYISGTRVVFNVIGPFSEKWVYSTIYSEKDFTLALEKNTLVILSPLEAKLIGLNESNLYNHSIIYNSRQYLMLIS